MLKCSGTWAEIRGPRQIQACKIFCLFEEKHTWKPGYRLKITNRLSVRTRALFTIHLFLWPYFQTNLSVHRAKMCGWCRGLFVCLMFCFQGDAASLFPPFTARAYYPAPAAARRQARVFMASIKSVCIPCHPTARDLQRIWQTHWIKKRSVQFV